MIYCDRFDATESIGIKTSIPKNVLFVFICIFYTEFRFQSSVCNGCYNVLMMTLKVTSAKKQ